MLSSILPNKQLTFSSIHYDARSYGEMNYLNVAKFLYSAHTQHWKDLPNIKKFKGNMSLKDEYIKDTKAILSLEGLDLETPKPQKIEIQEITPANYKYQCGDKTVGLCFIIFLDGKNETMKKESFQLMSDVETMMENEGRLWAVVTVKEDHALPLVVTRALCKKYLTLLLIIVENSSTRSRGWVQGMRTPS